MFIGGLRLSTSEPYRDPKTPWWVLKDTALHQLTRVKGHHPLASKCHKCYMHIMHLRVLRVLSNIRVHTRTL